MSIKIDRKPACKKLKFLPLTHGEVCDFAKSIGSPRIVRPFHFAIGAWDDLEKMVGAVTVVRTGYREEAEISEIYSKIPRQEFLGKKSIEDMLAEKCQAVWKAMTGGNLLGLPGSTDHEAAHAELDYISDQNFPLQYPK